MDTFAPNYSVTVKGLTLTFSCTTAPCLLGQHIKISGTLCCKILSALGIKNALQTIESSIQVQFSKFLYMLNTLHYKYNTSEQMLSLPYKWSAFEIQQALEHHLVSSGMRMHTLPQWIIIVYYYVNYNCLHKQLVNTSISHLPSGNRKCNNGVNAAKKRRQATHSKARLQGESTTLETSCAR